MQAIKHSETAYFCSMRSSNYMYGVSTVREYYYHTFAPIYIIFMTGSIMNFNDIIKQSASIFVMAG